MFNNDNFDAAPVSLQTPKTADDQKPESLFCAVCFTPVYRAKNKHGFFFSIREIGSTKNNYMVGGKPVGNLQMSRI